MSHSKSLMGVDYETLSGREAVVSVSGCEELGAAILVCLNTDSNTVLHPTGLSTCTIVPMKSDGMPLSALYEFSENPSARLGWPN